MTDTHDTESEDTLPFRRRDILKAAGGVGALTIGADPATASRPKQHVVGTKPGRANVAARNAADVGKVIDLKEVGQTVTGRWPEEALNGLKNNPHIRYVEELQFDTAFYSLPDQILPWGVDRVDAEIAHNGGNTGSGIDVVISDTGIDADHPDLEANLGDGFVPDSNDECADSSHPDGSCDEDWDDDSGNSHGSHVAGTVGAIDNGEGVIGVAPDVTLHALKILPSGSHTAIEEGLKWAADQGYDVVNMSHGGSDSGPKQDGIEYAANRGVLLVAAAGNTGGNVEFPAAYDEVIAVSNITDDDAIRGDSSRGSEIDIGAPGDQIPSAANDGEYRNLGGTSMASPHVAGAGAQLIANGEDAAGARDTLEETAEDIGLSDTEQGNGLLDLANALGHDSANDLTEVETEFANDIQYTEAQLNGRLTELTGNDDADVFFQYREVGGSSWTTTPTETVSSTGLFDRPISGLAEDTAYEFRAGVTVTEPDEGWSSTEYGDVDTFETVDNPDPTASFTIDPPVPDPGDTVEFDGSSSDPGESFGVSESDAIDSYEWDFEDDGKFDDSGKTVTHTFTDPGDVTIRLRVTDEFGQIDETTQTFRVNELPEAAFEWTPSVPTDGRLPNEGEEITFDAGSSTDSDGNIAGYEWEFGDGTTATGEIVTHTYGPLGDGNWGNFDVTLTVTDNDGATDEATRTVEVNAYPVAEFDVLVDPPETPAVRDEPVEFDASASMDPDDGNIVSYEWDFEGDGMFVAAGANPTYTYDEGGEKTVTLRVTDDNGASHGELSMHDETITVHIQVTVEIIPDVINPRRPGNVPVAVHHTADFDSSVELDPNTVQFGTPETVNAGEGAEPAHNGGHVEDVDGDGDDDWLCHFAVPDTDFERGDDEGKLVGKTTDSPAIPVFGVDEVRTVGRN